MGETTNGVELSRLLLHRGTTAAEIASMELEILTHRVGYRRKRKVPPDAIDSALTDEQIAKAIRDYARTDPIDWPVKPQERVFAKIGKDLLKYLLWAFLGFLGCLPVYLQLMGEAFDTDYPMIVFIAFMLFTPLLVVGPIVGIIAGALAYTCLKRVLTGKSAVIWATICVTAISIGLGLAFIERPRRTDRLPKGCPPDCQGISMSDAYLEGVELQRADLLSANLRGADLTGANLRETNLREADLSGANLTGATMPNGMVHE
jgi:hypothetical protein